MRLKDFLENSPRRGRVYLIFSAPAGGGLRGRLAEPARQLCVFSAIPPVTDHRTEALALGRTTQFTRVSSEFIVGGKSKLVS